MRDLLDILSAVDQTVLSTEPATLATVVRVEGSSYRLPGARMLVTAAGERFGSVSGGCLEADVARRGRLLTDDNRNVLVRYDGSDEEAAWGFGLGCNGSIEVFIERLAASSQPIEFIRRCMQQCAAGVLATMFAAAGRTSTRPGDSLAMTKAGIQYNSIQCNELASAIEMDALSCLAQRESATITYQLGGACIHALVESIQPPTHLIIFGAGHDALPLMRAAKSLGWHVTIWDRRPGYARADRFPGANAVICCEAADIADKLQLTPDTAAVVMTHHYPDDRQLLETLLRSPARYIGALGPRARTERILAEAADTGFRPAQERLDRLHAPVGLDIGAEGPDQVAIAIIGEILTVLNERPGGPLRRRAGPIHRPAATRIVSAESVASKQFTAGGCK